MAVIRALNKIQIKPDFIIIDGNKIIPSADDLSRHIQEGYKDDPEKMQLLLDEVRKVNYPWQQQKAIVKGDAKCFSIAAASILAKVERDRHIDELAKLVHEDYDWIHNKSYYSAGQVEAIKKHGKTIYHREKYVRKYLV